MLFYLYLCGWGFLPFQGGMPLAEPQEMFPAFLCAGIAYARHPVIRWSGVFFGFLEAEYYSKIFKDVDLREIVGAMARMHKKTARGKDIVIPGRVIGIMHDNNEGDSSWEELCGIYLKEYLASSEVMDIKKLWI